jgi:TRAP-type C4-dicarboxylate transport system substrate-binding protein
MKQKTGILLLTVLTLTVLIACSGKGSSPTTTAPARADTASTPLTIRFSTTFNETETGGVIIKKFIDELDARSSGAVKVNINWGGTLFGTMDELDAVVDGAVDMVALGHMPHTGTLNYLGFFGFPLGGSQGALDHFNELIFKNPETSALIQGEAEALGIKYLNVIAGGANAICTKYPFTDLSSLVKGSRAFGNFAAAQWEALGFQVIALPPPDIYDGFNRGLIDSTQMGLKPMVALSWYEVAPYWALDGSYTAGNMFTVNLAWWNRLTDDQRRVIEEAALAAEEYSRIIYDEAIAADIKEVEEKTGNKFVELSQEDTRKIWTVGFDANSATAINNASKNNKVPGMIKILEVAAQLNGYQWKQN